MKISPKRRFAFTLIEILVVLAIMTLLAALLFAAFGRARENGRAASCLSNQKQILLALQLYQEDAAGTLPFRNTFDIHNVNWVDALLIYAETPSLFVCPSDSEIEHKRVFGFITVAADGSKQPTIPSSYIAGEELLSRPGNPIRPRALSEVANPSSTIFLCDGVKQAFPHAPFWTDKVVNHDLANDLGMLGYILRDPADSHADGSYGEGYAPNPRHNGRANVGFVDGHVKSMDLASWYFPDSPFLDPKRGG